MKRSKRSKLNPPREHEANGPQYFTHSLSGIDAKEFSLSLLAASEASIQKFPEHLQTLTDLFRRVFPLHVVAVSAGYGLSAGVSNEGVTDSLVSGLGQHHIEMLQALALRMPSSEWGVEPAAPSDIQIAIDTVQALSNAFHMRRFVAVSDIIDTQERTAIALREKLRLHTQAVRNWGYFSQVVEISSELYASLNDDFLDAFGFGSIDLIKLMRAVVDILEYRNNKRFGILKKIFRERNVRRIVKQFFRLYPGMPDNAEKFLADVPNWASLEHVKAHLLCIADISLVANGAFIPADICKETNFPESLVLSVFESLSLRRGELEAFDPEHLFLNNPVWTRPFIEDNDQFFCASPQVVFSFIHPIIRTLAERAGLKSKLESARALYLERKIEELVRSALPAASVNSGVKWTCGEAIYETDLVAQLDGVFLIIEAKSGALTDSGLRGAPDRVKRHVRELILEPSEQSARLEAVIWQAKAGDVISIESLADFEVPWEKIQSVVRLSITLDDFSILSSSEQDMKSAGWIKSDVTLAPCINIADFATIVEILCEPIIIMHYIIERARVQKEISFIADELDLLGFYLKTGFNLEEMEKDRKRLVLTEMSKSIDHYFMSCEAGVLVPKPRLQLRPFFERIVLSLQRRSSPGWTILALALLKIGDYYSQCRVERKLQNLRLNVRKKWRDADHECALVLTPTSDPNCVIVFYVYPARRARDSRGAAAVIASKAMEQSGRQRCVIVGKQVERWEEPYAFVYLCGRGENEE